ncbi:MAG: hypothetical protein ABI972_10200 [Acidobacteriota bacterium]
MRPFLILLAPLALAAQTAVLENTAVRAVFDLAGGSLVEFQLRDKPLNPLTWESPGEPGVPRPRGHFICFDRWGQPSAAELKNGMPFHGEATRVRWKLDSSAAAEARMSVALPIAGLTMDRTAKLAGGAALRVTETVTNRNKLGRMFNLVQHATIAPPFLDEATVVDANARKGFMQSSPMPNPEEPPVWWPQALQEGRSVDLRHLTDDHNPNVVSYVVDEEYGWVTAASPSKGLLIGYIWRVREYPWLNIWRNVEKGKPTARGLEFGTTGLHQPFETLIAKGRIFGRRLYGYLDANASETRSYAAFLAKIPSGYAGAAKVTYDGTKLTIAERGSEQTIAIETGPLFPD